MPNAEAARGLMVGLVMLLKDHALRTYVLDQQNMNEMLEEDDIIGEEEEVDDSDDEGETKVPRLAQIENEGTTAGAVSREGSIQRSSQDGVAARMVGSMSGFSLVGL